jgi:hypothetical protein
MEEKKWDEIFPVGTKVRIKVDAAYRPGDEGTVVNCFHIAGSYWAVHIRFSEHDNPVSFMPREVELNSSLDDYLD